jgi:hypothetical protein
VQAGDPSGQNDPSVAVPTAMATESAAMQNGGYLRGTRRRRLLSVAVFSSAFVLGWRGSRLPTDYVSIAKVSCRARGHDLVRGRRVRLWVSLLLLASLARSATEAGENYGPLKAGTADL